MRVFTLSQLRPVLALCCGVALLAAPPKAKPKAPEPGRNLQVFKGQRLTDHSLDAAMDFMSASLGVSCAHCHVKDDAKKTWAMERDDLPAKQTARRMVRMTRALNKAHFGGAEIITCATCHNGQPKPASMPALREVGAVRPAPATAAAADLPTLEALLAKWVQASGGREALEQVATRQAKGTLDLGGGRALPVEVLQSAPGRSHSVITSPRGLVAETFDGTRGWRARGGKASPLEGIEARLAALDADLRLPLTLRTHFPSLTVLGRETVEGQEALTVAARTQDGLHALLAFDAASGHLVRRTTFTATPLGRMPTEVTWQDFRAVDGVHVPFKATTRTPERASVTTYAEIKQGLPVDEALFKHP